MFAIPCVRLQLVCLVKVCYEWPTLNVVVMLPSMSPYLSYPTRTCPTYQTHGCALWINV